MTSLLRTMTGLLHAKQTCDLTADAVLRGQCGFESEQLALHVHSYAFNTMI